MEKDYSINKKLNLTHKKIIKTADSSAKSLYNDLKLSKFLDFEVFFNAINGLNQIKTSKKDILTIVDFSKFSLKKDFL